MHYAAIVEQNTDGNYIAYSRELGSGACHGIGPTPTTALHSYENEEEDYLESLNSLGKPLPPKMPFEKDSDSEWMNSTHTVSEERYKRRLLLNKCPCGQLYPCGYPDDDNRDYIIACNHCGVEIRIPRELLGLATWEEDAIAIYNKRYSLASIRKFNNKKKPR